MLSEKDLYGSDTSGFTFPNRRRDPFPPRPAMTSTVAAPAKPVTLEAILTLIEETELPPNPPPLFDPDRVVIYKPAMCGRTELQMRELGQMRIIGPDAEVVELTLTLPGNRCLAWGAR